MKLRYETPSISEILAPSEYPKIRMNKTEVSMGGIKDWVQMRMNLFTSRTIIVFSGIKDVFLVVIFSQVQEDFFQFFIAVFSQEVFFCINFDYLSFVDDGDPFTQLFCFFEIMSGK